MRRSLRPAQNFICQILYQKRANNPLIFQRYARPQHALSDLAARSSPLSASRPSLKSFINQNFHQKRGLFTPLLILALRPSPTLPQFHQTKRTLSFYFQSRFIYYLIILSNDNPITRTQASAPSNHLRMAERQPALFIQNLFFTTRLTFQPICNIQPQSFWWYLPPQA